MAYVHHHEIDAATGLRLKITPDPCPLDPRTEFDHLGRMVCWHRRYRLGDAHAWSDPQAFLAEMTLTPHLRLPLYLYDHSGITISTRPFSCPWDSGQVGWIVLERARLLAEFSARRVTKRLREKGFALLGAEVAEYDQYLTGDVWDVRIESADGDVLDSCGEFYGAEYAVEEGRGMLAACVAERRETDACALAEAIQADRPDMKLGGSDHLAK